MKPNEVFLAPDHFENPQIITWWRFSSTFTEHLFKELSYADLYKRHVGRNKPLFSKNVTFPDICVSQSWAMLKQKIYPLRLPGMWEQSKRMGSRRIRLFQSSTEFNQSRPLQTSSKPCWAALLPCTEITTGRQDWKVFLDHQVKPPADVGCVLHKLIKLHLTRCWFGGSQSCWKVLLNNLMCW